MANWSDPRTTAVPRAAAGARDAAFDAGLRSYMLSVYNYMASGVLLTGIVAMLFARGGADSMAAHLFVGGGLLPLVVIFAPVGIVFWMSFGIQRMSETTAKALFWSYAVLMGLSTSVIFLVYTGSSIAQTFFATAASFAALSLYGYTTKRNLAPLGAFFFMAVIGLIVAMVINMFMPASINGPMNLIISGIGVLLFAGITAYRTQMIKSDYFTVRGTDFQGRAAIIGALGLYIAFLNMFMFLLRFMGNRR